MMHLVWAEYLPGQGLGSRIDRVRAAPMDKCCDTQLAVGVSGQEGWGLLESVNQGPDFAPDRDVSSWPSPAQGWGPGGARRAWSPGRGVLGGNRGGEFLGGLGTWVDICENVKPNRIISRSVPNLGHNLATN